MHYGSSTKTAYIWTHVSNNITINLFSGKFLVIFYWNSLQNANQLKFHPKIGHVALTGKNKVQANPLIFSVCPVQTMKLHQNFFVTHALSSFTVLTWFTFLLNILLVCLLSSFASSMSRLTVSHVSAASSLFGFRTKRLPWETSLRQGKLKVWLNKRRIRAWCRLSVTLVRAPQCDINDYF